MTPNQINEQLADASYPVVCDLLNSGLGEEEIMDKIVESSVLMFDRLAPKYRAKFLASLNSRFDELGNER